MIEEYYQLTKVPKGNKCPFCHLIMTDELYWSKFYNDFICYDCAKEEFNSEEEERKYD